MQTMTVGVLVLLLLLSVACSRTHTSLKIAPVRKGASHELSQYLTNLPSVELHGVPTDLVIKVEQYITDVALSECDRNASSYRFVDVRHDAQEDRWFLVYYVDYSLAFDDEAYMAYACDGHPPDIHYFVDVSWDYTGMASWSDHDE
jgi:hypothetical protein